MSIYINNSKPVIIIDQSYYIFNRYFASLSWFRRQTDKELDYNNLTQNDEFILAFFRHFENDINKLTKKFKTIKGNVILCNDCNRSEIWRNEIYKDYKDGRGKKSNFDSQIFVLFKNYICNNSYNYCELDNLEADDIAFLLQDKINEQGNDENLHKEILD